MNLSLANKNPQPRNPDTPQRPVILLSKFLVAVLIVFIGAEVVARAWVAPRIGDANASKDVQIERQIGFVRNLKPDGVDVVVAGTSMAGVGIDPEVLTAMSGQSAFNAALGCANPLVVSDWIPNFVARELSPEVVVLAITPSDLDPESCPRAWTDIELLTVPAGDQRTLSQRLDLQPFLRENSALWRQRPWLRQINNLPFLVFDREWTWDVTFRDDGFWQVDAWAEVDQETYLLEPHRTQISVDQARVDAIAATVADLEASGIEVVIAELPMAMRWIDHLDASLVSYDQAEAALRETAERAGATYLPSPEEFHDNIYFIDEGHMTPEGALSYSAWLGSQIAR